MDTYFSSACAIGLLDSVIITGGQYSLNRVQEYNLSGALGRLPDLKTGRQDHACGRFIHNGEVVSRMLMYMSQMLYAGQSARLIVTFLSDF